MKSPPPMPMPPPPPVPPPSYQESLKNIQNTSRDNSYNMNDHPADFSYVSEFNTDESKYSNRPMHHHYYNNNNNNKNAVISNESFVNPVSDSISYSSNNDMRQYLKAQQNSGNKRDLSQYLGNQQPHRNASNSEFMRTNSPASGFFQNHQNYTSIKKAASNFTSEIEKELSDLTLTIEREMELQNSQKQKSEYFGLCAKCNKGKFKELRLNQKLSIRGDL